MKQQLTIEIAAISGLIPGSLNASAAGFGGGWMLDKDTGTLYNSLAPTHERQQVATDTHQTKGHMNSFEGGWVQDKNTGTLYNSLALSQGHKRASAS